MVRKYGVDNIFKQQDFIDKNLKNVLENKKYSETFKEIFLSKEKAITFLKRASYNYFDLVELFNAPYPTVIQWAARLDVKQYIRRNENKSHYEDELSSFLKSLDISFKSHDRSFLSGQELDIYIPAKKLAIEFDGTYWHEVSKRDAAYHFEKSKACEQRGIRLIHVYEYQWICPHKRLIIQDIIKKALGMPNKILNAADCCVQLLQKADAQEFFKNNSLQEFSDSEFYLGLYFADELLIAAAFDTDFTSNVSAYSCSQIAFKLGAEVLGGPDAIFNYFITHYSPKRITLCIDYNLYVDKPLESANFVFSQYSGGHALKVLDSKSIKRMLLKENIGSTKTTTFTLYDAGVKEYLWEAL